MNFISRRDKLKSDIQKMQTGHDTINVRSDLKQFHDEFVEVEPDTVQSLAEAYKLKLERMKKDFSEKIDSLNKKIEKLENTRPAAPADPEFNNQVEMELLRLATYKTSPEMFEFEVSKAIKTRAGATAVLKMQLYPEYKNLLKQSHLDAALRNSTTEAQRQEQSLIKKQLDTYNQEKGKTVMNVFWTNQGLNFVSSMEKTNYWK